MVLSTRASKVVRMGMYGLMVTFSTFLERTHPPSVGYETAHNAVTPGIRPYARCHATSDRA